MIQLSRRHLLASSGLLATLAAAPAAARTLLADEAIVLFDPDTTESARFAKEAGKRIAIEGDLVRQWRDGLGETCATAPAVIAKLRWHHAVLLSGLMREARRKVKIEKLPDGLVFVRAGASARA